MVKILLNICLLVLLIEPIFSQGEVVEGKFYGVERDFDSKKYGITNKNGDTIKTIRNEYEMNHIKNSLSDYNSNSITKIGFAVDMEIVPSKIQLVNISGNTLEGDIFYVKNKINYIL